MKIGELAALSSTGVETIRYYEREGLLPAPARSESNYRVYEPEHVERLRFIRHCRGLDMSLDEVRVLLGFRDQPRDACGDVEAVLDAHIGHVTDRIRELRALEDQLRGLRQRCAGPGEDDHCGILAGLVEDAGAAGKPPGGHVHSAHGRSSPPRR